MTEAKESKQSIEGFSQHGLAVATSSGAITFALVSTLGSGSYLEVVPESLKQVSITALFTLTTLAMIFFALFVWGFFSYFFTIPKTKTYDVAWLKKFRYYAYITSGAIFAILISGIFVVYLSEESDMWYMRYYEIFGVRQAPIVFFLEFLSKVLFCIALTATGAHMIYEALATDWITYVAALIILALSAPIWYNQFRDSQKNAFITDSEYCYWQHASAASVPDGVKSTARDTYHADPTCSAQRAQGVVHHALRVSDSELQSD